MTELTKQDIQRIAQLAKINVDDNDVEKYASMLSKIFDFIDQINTANTDSIVPMAHPISGQIQRLRADEVTETNQRECFQSISSHTDNGVYLVPKVIDSE